MQLGLHGGVAERFDYGWGKVGKGCSLGKQLFGKSSGTVIVLPGSTNNMWER